MKFARKMFGNEIEYKGVFSIGFLNIVKDSKVNMMLGIIDSTFGVSDYQKRNKICDLNDIRIIETDNDNWSLDYFDGVDSWIKVSKWIDFLDPDGDQHHGRLTRFWDPNNPSDIHYCLEVDLLSEPS